MILNGIYIEPLLKAFKKLEVFRRNINTDQEKAGAIQAFEYTFELVWKTMKRFLEQRGSTAYSPREVFRLAALESFIQDPEIWFDFLKKRNLTCHTYQEEEAEEVIKILEVFSEETRKFLKIIGVPEDAYKE